MERWQRTVRVLWLVQFLTTLAMNLGLTFVPFFLAEDPVLQVRDESARLVYTGLILAGPFFTSIVFTPLWGWVADRTGPKRQVVRACLGLGITQLLLSAAQSPDQIVAIRILQGMLSGVLAACLGLVAVVSPPGFQGRAVATVQSATPIGQLCAPLFGGVLATALGFRATYVILGTLILITAVLSAFLLRQTGFVPAQTPNPFRALYRSGRRSFAQPILRQALIILVLGQFAFTIAQGVFAIYAGNVIAVWVNETGASPVWWNSGIGFTAMAMTVTALASAVSALTWGRLHDQRTPFLTPAGAGLLVISMLVLFAVPTWWAILIARVGVGVGIGAMYTLQFAVVAARVAPQERGQLMGLATAISQVGNLVGFVLSGVLAAQWSEAGNFLLAAGVYAAVMFAALHLEHSARRAAANGFKQ
ncbi:MAG TPA: MFS transporter [Gemmata sp.]|nr:MFS transporter [Gemmata sp.]